MYRLLLAWTFRAVAGSAMVIGSCLTCVGQQAGLIDLSQDMPEHDLRRPPAKPGDPIKRIGAIEHYDDCTHSSADPAIQITVIGTDRKEYKEGDEQRFEVRLTNVGSTPVKIPFSADLGALQPADPGTKFKYSELTVQVWIIGGKSWSANTGGTATLYGSEHHPKSLLELEPGEWAEILGSGEINFPSEHMPPHPPRSPITGINTQITIEKFESIFTSTEAATVAHSVCLKQTQGPDLPLTVEPRQSENR